MDGEAFENLLRHHVPTLDDLDRPDAQASADEVPAATTTNDVVAAPPTFIDPLGATLLQSNDPHPSSSSAELQPSQCLNDRWSTYHRSRETAEEIERDLVRLQLSPLPHSYFMQEGRHEALLHVLLVYALEHPDLGYRQGMHEIAGHLLLALESDDAEGGEEEDDSKEDKGDDSNLAGTDQVSKGGGGGDTIENKVKQKDAINSVPLFPPSDPLSAPSHQWSSLDDDFGVTASTARKDLEPLVDKVPSFATDSTSEPAQLRKQAALYTLFTAMMGRLRPLYEHGGGGANPGRNHHRATTQMSESCASVLKWLAKADKSFSDHLSAMDISPQLYCIKWFRLVFSREVTSYFTALELWDNIFMLTTCLPFTAVNSRLRLINVLEVAATAMILLQRDTIIQGGPDEALICLMRYPPLQEVTSLVHVMQCLCNQTEIPSMHPAAMLSFNSLNNGAFLSEQVPISNPPEMFPCHSACMSTSVIPNQEPNGDTPSRKFFSKRIGGAFSNKFSTLAENVATITGNRIGNQSKVDKVPLPASTGHAHTVDQEISASHPLQTTTLDEEGSKASPLPPFSDRTRDSHRSQKSDLERARVSTSRDHPIQWTRRNATNLPELAVKLDSTVSVLVKHLTERQEYNPPPEVWEALAQIQGVATVLNMAGRCEVERKRDHVNNS
mmetsp:Transcript_35332/g.81879  ORF Transcript_35332/g.81879 Transcript_35332/m.81879 type:complete len:669 (-) Transcript_35332:124-2130(-)